MIIFIYTFLVFLVLRFSVTLFNFLSNPKLGNYGRHFNDKVSILIKKEEGADISAVLTSIEEQDYENTEVIILNDFSDKEKIEAAKGDYLLFLEGETLLEKGLINSLIYRTKVFNLALVNIIPTQLSTGFLSHCVYPLSDFILLNLFPLRLVKLIGHPIFSAANDACLFFDGDVYRKNQWHAQLKGKTFSALELMKILKQDRFKADLLLANRLLYLRQDDNPAAINSFSRKLMQYFNNFPLVAIGYLVLVIGGPVTLFLEFEPVFFILPIGLIFMTRVMISFLSSQNALLNLVLHPLQMLTLVFLVFNNFWNRLSGGHK